MFFRPKGQLPLSTDIHSHLVPGVDDGVRSVDEAVRIIKGFYQLGYRRLITTPHVSESYYPNSVEVLQTSFAELKEALRDIFPDMTIGLGAEYMVDAMFMDTVKKGGELLTWNDHILVETSFHMLPWIFDEVIFELQSRGLIVVLAHPERYPYFLKDDSTLKAMYRRGVRMQLTVGSFSGQYGDKPKKMARHLLHLGMVDFLGSDVHKEEHLDQLKKGLQSSDLSKMKVSDFANHRLN